LYAVATETLMRLNDDDQDCVLVPQVLYEFWVVATRPIDVNGLELSVDDAKLAIEKWMTAYRILLDEGFTRRRGGAKKTKPLNSSLSGFAPSREAVLVF